MTAGAAGRDRPVPPQPVPPPTEATSRDGSGAAEDRGPLRATTVLADRMAAALVHREPGWRLPRRSALARRYNVSLTEIDAALGDLARRSLVRRLPDGQLYRASPADYWIPGGGHGRPGHAAGSDGRVDRLPDPACLAPRGAPGRRLGPAAAVRRADPRGQVRLVVRGRSGRRVHRLPERTARRRGRRTRSGGGPAVALARLGAEHAARRRGQRRDVASAAVHRP